MKPKQLAICIGQFETLSNSVCIKITTSTKIIVECFSADLIMNIT